MHFVDFLGKIATILLPIYIYIYFFFPFFYVPMAMFSISDPDFLFLTGHVKPK